MIVYIAGGIAAVSIAALVAVICWAYSRLPDGTEDTQGAPQ